jgi:hypothetical protein
MLLVRGALFDIVGGPIIPFAATLAKKENYRINAMLEIIHTRTSN